MAVTIHDSPADYSLSGNPLIFVFSSNQTAQANFSYKIEVSIDAVLRETHEIFPEDGINAHFDASDVAERYAPVPLNLDAAVYNPTNNVLVKVDVIESYGTPPADQANLSSTITTYKGRQRKADFLAFDPTDYIFGQDKLWLTKFPRNEKIYFGLSLNNKYTFITDSNNLDLTIELYDSSDSLVATKGIGFAVRTKITTANINGTTLINDWGFSLAEFLQLSYLKIYWEDGIGIPSEKLTIYSEDRCLSSSFRHFVFMSPIGSLEPYTFIKRTVEKTKIKGEGYEIQFGEFDGVGNWVFNLGGVTDIIKKLEDRIEVQSDWLSEDESNWLTRSFLTAPLVYLLVNGNLVRVRVEAKGYQRKTSENDMVFNLKANVLIEYDHSVVV